jgi:hypothetical protein
MSALVLDPTNPEHLAAARAALAAAAEAPAPFEPTMIDLVPIGSGLRGYLATAENFEKLSKHLEGTMHPSGQEFYVKTTNGLSCSVAVGDVVVPLTAGIVVLFADEIGPDRLWQVRDVVRMLPGYDTITVSAVCEFPRCGNGASANVIDMENEWHSWCAEHAIADLTSTRERGA